MASPPPPGAQPRTESIASFLARLSLKLSAPYDQYLQALTDGGLENIAELRQLAVSDLVDLKIPRLRASVMIRAASEVHTCLFRLVLANGSNETLLGPVRLAGVLFEA